MKNAGAGRRLLFDWDFLFQRALHRFLHSLISDLQVIGAVDFQHRRRPWAAVQAAAICLDYYSSVAALGGNWNGRNRCYPSQPRKALEGLLIANQAQTGIIQS